MESVSAFVPILVNAKNKNTEFFLKRFNNLNHTNPSDTDYEKLKTKKTKLEFVLLSLVVFGIEICYAAETAFVSPILQKIGVPLQYMSMVWGLSPLVGFFACPILGSLSDGCRSKLGRRRPFIIIYSFGIFAGLLLLGYSHYIGNLFCDYIIDNPFVILFTILGVVLLDFNCDACQSPARAYLIDVSQSGDHSIGLSTFTIMAGAGGSLGYILGGIPWADLAPSNLKESYSTIEQSIFAQNQSNYSIITAFYYPSTANDHKQFLFTLVAIIYAISALISITSFKEIPLESATKQDNSCKVKYEKMQEDYEDDYEGNLEASNQQAINLSTENLTNKQKLLKNQYFQSIFKMPSSLKWLCLTHCFSWMSLLCFSLYFTDFFGEEIFGGDATENANFEDHARYNKGVRIGSFCMAIYSISCSVYSFFLQVLMNRFRTKNVYIFSQMVYCFGMLALASTKSIIIAPLASVTAGIMYSSLFTIPFILVASYHSSENFELLNKDVNEVETGVTDQNAIKQVNGELKRGLGTDLSIVSSMVFVAQFILSFFIGSLIKLFGTKTVVVYAASLFSFCAAISSTKLFYLD